MRYQSSVARAFGSSSRFALGAILQTRAVSSASGNSRIFEARLIGVGSEPITRLLLAAGESGDCHPGVESEASALATVIAEGYIAGRNFRGSRRRRQFVREAFLCQESQIATLVRSYQNGDNVVAWDHMVRQYRDTPAASARNAERSAYIGSREEARSRCHRLAVEQNDHLAWRVAVCERPSLDAPIALSLLPPFVTIVSTLPRTLVHNSAGALLCRNSTINGVFRRSHAARI